MGFPEPHQWKNIAAGSTERIYYMRVPEGKIAFITHIANNSFENTSINIKIDGESLEGKPIQREVGPMNSPTVFDPPFVSKNKIEVFGTNNDADPHMFEVLINGFFYDQVLPSLEVG